MSYEIISVSASNDEDVRVEESAETVEDACQTARHYASQHKGNPLSDCMTDPEQIAAYSTDDPESPIYAVRPA